MQINWLVSIWQGVLAVNGLIYSLIRIRIVVLMSNANVNQAHPCSLKETHAGFTGLSPENIEFK